MEQLLEDMAKAASTSYAPLIPVSGLHLLTARMVCHECDPQCSPTRYAKQRLPYNNRRLWYSGQCGCALLQTALESSKIVGNASPGDGPLHGFNWVFVLPGTSNWRLKLGQKNRP